MTARYELQRLLIGLVRKACPKLPDLHVSELAYRNLLTEIMPHVEHDQQRAESFARATIDSLREFLVEPIDFSQMAKAFGVFAAKMDAQGDVVEELDCLHQSTNRLAIDVLRLIYLADGRENLSPINAAELYRSEQLEAIWNADNLFDDRLLLANLAREVQRRLKTFGRPEDYSAKATARLLGGVWQQFTGKQPSLSRNEVDESKLPKGPFARYVLAASSLVPNTMEIRISGERQIRHSVEFSNEIRIKTDK